MPFDPVALPRKTALVADLFCGAGGSSSGAKRALNRLGYRMNLIALNHWNRAIATHSRNFPEARHILEDVNIAKPAQLVPEGKLDLLMASPSCVFHSRARGGRPINDQGRMDPWAIVRWCTELRVKRLLVENVPEFRDWGPLDLCTGKPIKRRRGEYFRSWVAALEGCGFRVEWRALNAADFGDATTRERFFLIGRSDGRQLHWPEPTHSRDGIDLLGQRTCKWRPAREIIDWSIEGRSIFGRKRSLAPKTLARIYAGAVKFRWPEPFLAILRQHMDAQSLDDPLPTLCAGGTRVGVAEPFTLSVGSAGAPRSINAPLMTITTGGAGSPNPGCARPALVEPFVTSLAHSRSHALIAPYYGEGSGATCGQVADPLPTVTTKARFGLVVPVTNSTGGPGPRSIDDPIATMTTAKGGEFALVMPLTHDDGSNRARSIEEPLPTVTAAQRGELAFIAASFGEAKNQAPCVHGLEKPMPTICAQGRVQLVEPVSDGRTYDIRFRMLEPHELARAMGFFDAEGEYEFIGTKTEITKMIGNAVPVQTACALVSALMGS